MIDGELPVDRADVEPLAGVEGRVVLHGRPGACGELVLPDIGNELAYLREMPEQAIGALGDTTRDTNDVIVDLGYERVARASKEHPVGTHPDIVRSTADDAQRHAGSDGGIDLGIEVRIGHIVKCRY
jgi:hypothetical protein